MLNKNNDNPYIEVSISDWGNSQAIRIPKKILKTLDITSSEKVYLNIIDKNHVMISKNLPPKKGTIDYYLQNYEGGYLEDEKEIDWGEPVGSEIW